MITICSHRPWDVMNAGKYCYDRVITERKDLTIENLEGSGYVFFPSWSWIIPEEIWRNFKCVVFHMTDLPFGRGGSPLQNLLSRGIYETVISAVRVDGGLDTGPVYMKFPLSLFGNAQEIYERASEIIFRYMIPHIMLNNPVPVPQEGEVVTFKRRSPGMSRMDNPASLIEMYDHIRMLDCEGYPKAFLDTDDLYIEFTDAVLCDGKITAKCEIRMKND